MDLPVPTDRERVIGLTVPVPEPWASQVRSARAAAGDPLAHTAPHVTILPPTLVPADGLPAVTSFLRTTLTGVPAFTVHLAGVESFEPVSPVVYLALTQGARECTDLQARVRSADGPLRGELRFPYHPHVTLAHLPDHRAQDRAARVGRGIEAVFVVEHLHLHELGADGSSTYLRSLPLGVREAG